MDDEARTLTRRGAALVKYCRGGARPHLAHVQISSDARAIEWVGRRAKTKRASLLGVLHVAEGRRSDVFKRASATERVHHDDVCFSVVYDRERGRGDAGADGDGDDDDDDDVASTGRASTTTVARGESGADAGRKKRRRTLDLACEDAAQRATWVRGIRLAVETARRAAAATRRDAKTASMMQSSTPFAAADSAADRAERARASTDASTSGGNPAPPPPGDVFVWGRVPSVMTTPETLASSPHHVVVDRFVMTPSPVPALGGAACDPRSIALGTRHAVAATRAGGVYTWGDGVGGRLGHGDVVDRATPTRVRAADDVFDVKAGGGGDGGARAVVRCGGDRTVVLTRDRDDDGVEDGGGALYAWGGSGDDFGVGGGGGGSSAEDAATRWTLSRIWFSSSSSSSPEARITRVSVGMFHVAAVSVDGALFTWGEGAFHALGHGGGGGGGCGGGASRPPTSEPRPRRVEGLRGRVVADVSCGVWHTAAVVDDGQLYTWGDGDGGKLGHADVTDDVPVPTPRRVADWTPGGGGGGGGEEKNASEIVVIVAASCGQSHTLALDANGVAWCLGSVGKTGAPPPPTPRRIASIPDAVASLSSGDSHAAALTRRGRLYVWGVGKRGALGHGGFGEELAPRLLEGALEGRTIREVTCGPESTAVVVDAAALTKREKIEVRSIHWSPYDRVGDVDADP